MAQLDYSARYARKRQRSTLFARLASLGMGGAAPVAPALNAPYADEVAKMSAAGDGGALKSEVRAAAIAVTGKRGAPSESPHASGRERSGRSSGRSNGSGRDRSRSRSESPVRAAVDAMADAVSDAATAAADSVQQQLVAAYDHISDVLQSALGPESELDPVQRNVLDEHLRQSRWALVQATAAPAALLSTTAPPPQPLHHSPLRRSPSA